MKSAILATALVLAGCGHASVSIPCTKPHPTQSPCVPVRCKEGEPACVCDGPECWRMTLCPVPIPEDARVSR